MLARSGAIMPGPTIEEILQEEYAQLELSRKLRLGDSLPRPPVADSAIGLSFSGGGIRSATFNLGILQALAKGRMLRAFDYLSTVSGGGYISSWLMAWMHHQKIGIKKIEELLADQPVAPRLERPEVRFLRSYSNYLTPRKGLLGADFWAFTGSYLRNMLLNQTILILSLLSLLLIPRCILFVLHFFEILEQDSSGYHGMFENFKYSQYFALLAGLIAGAVAVVFMGLNLGALAPGKNAEYRWYTYQQSIQVLIVIPLFVSAAMLSYGAGMFLVSYQILAHPAWLALLGATLYSAMWGPALIVRWLSSPKATGSEPAGPSALLILVTAILAGAIVGFFFIPFSRIVMSAVPWSGVSPHLYPNRHVLTFGTPAFVLIMLGAGVLHIGLMGRQMRDGSREWWARLGGTLGVYSLCCLFIFLISVYFPFVLWKVLQHSHGKPLTYSAALAWVASTLYGVTFAKSAKTSDVLPDAPTRQKIFAYLAKLGPYVFILGFLLLLSLVAARIANALSGDHGPTVGELRDETFYPWWVLAVCGASFLAAVLLAWRVDVNEFSIHYLYRNRLVRCYLGASVMGRNAQPYTGFSEQDDVPLASLQIPNPPVDGVDDRPLPILNTSLNVVRGKELGLQTRKARSFALTPLYGGFTRPIAGGTTSESIFAPTAAAGADRPDSRDGARLGTAMAISGAAASPNMGSYSAPDLAFLMTLFDVRLGWWLANPKGKVENWRSTSPTFGFYWLLCELLGATNDDSDYVYLSDGGHFENLGIYELVRRRCKLIVASDASCDSAYGFSDLHNAMERCRSDFGIEITVTADETGRITPAGQPPRASAHFAIGTIHYTPGNSHDDGVLIYLKPALVAADAADILGYSSRNSSFPNDTTANQWFDESHFENYRAMGEATGRAALDTIDAAIRRALHK
jgi:Patatin-like phospholipase